jgi:hypothetical protein
LTLFKAKEMSEYQTLKREMYFDEVIRLRYEFGYGETKIGEILPISHATAGRWIRKFAAENKGITTAMARTKKEKTAPTPKKPDRETKDDNIQTLKAELSAMKTKLRLAEMRADLYDEMINVAEKKFKVEIRKKAGAKR